MQDCIQKNTGLFQPKVAVIINKNDKSKTRKVHTKGCNCRHSKCQKKYCECFVNQMKCTILCQCLDCENQIQDSTNNHILSKLSKKLENSNENLFKNSHRKSKRKDFVEPIIKKYQIASEIMKNHQTAVHMLESNVECNVTQLFTKN